MVLGTLDGPLVLLGPCWGPWDPRNVLGDPSELPGRPLGDPWAPLGDLWGPLGGPWWPLGGAMGVHWEVLGWPLGSQGRRWEPLRRPWDHLVAPWGPLGSHPKSLAGALEIIKNHSFSLYFHERVHP